MKVQRRRMAAVICAAVLGLAACGSSSSGGGNNAGGTSSSTSAGRVTLRLAASTQGGGYPTPFGAVRGPGVLLTTFLFDTLTYPDVTGAPRPWLATSWQTSADGKTWTLRLHKNVKWQDGQPLTADDVAFSFDYDLHGPGASTGVAQALNYIDSVSATDPSTVVIKLKTVRASFLSDISGFGFGVAIIPKHIWASVTDPAHFQGPKALIGSGPYRLKKFDLSTGTYDFVANDAFYLGKPRVKELQLVQVGDELLALQRGEIDAGGGGNNAIPQSQFNTLKRQFTLLTAPGEFNEALFFNLAAGFPYDQVAFRHAVAYALDRKDMLQRLVSGRGVPGSAGGLGPDNPFLDKNVPDYLHDPGQAKALLDQVGLTDRNGDGVRDKPDGSSFTIPLLTSSSDSQQAQLVSEYLRAVGLNVSITSVDQPTSDARDAKGDYQMAVVHFGGLGSDPSGLISRFASTAKSKSFTRVQGYHNPKFDQLAAQQATTLDPAKRKQLVDQMQVILANDLPELPLYIPEQITFVNTKVFNAWSYTPGCPPCGATKNKRMLVTGSSAPVPSGGQTS